MIAEPIVHCTEPRRLEDTERRRLSALHQPVHYKYLTDEDETAVRIEPPYCGACHESWGKDGCSTTRALVRLAFMEASAQQAKVDEENMRKSLADISVTPRWQRLKDRGILQCTIEVDSWALHSGGPRVIEYALHEMRQSITAEYHKRGAVALEKARNARGCESLVHSGSERVS